MDKTGYLINQILIATQIYIYEIQYTPKLEQLVNITGLSYRISYSKSEIFTEFLIVNSLGSHSYEI